MKKLAYKISRIVAYLVPVDKKMIILSSNPSYQDNTGALFNTMINEKYNEKYKIIWLVFDELKPLKEYPNCEYILIESSNRLRNIMNLIKINFLYARAKFIFFSHDHQLLFYPKKNQRVINLTHGIPLKNTTGKHRSQRFVTDILTTSDFARELKSFTIDSGEDKFRILGYPRNDYLFWKTSRNWGNFFIWLPTYRTHRNSLSKGDFDFFPLSPNSQDLKRLDLMLEEKEYMLLIKPHPAQKIKIDQLKLNNVLIIDDKYLYDHDLHLYQILSQSQVLITDYSSVYLDYLLIDKPIIFTFDDIEDYKKEWGFTVSDVNEVTPGEKVYNIDELIIALEKIIEGQDDFKEERKMNRDKFHHFKDDKSSKRILDFFNM